MDMGEKGDNCCSLSITSSLMKLSSQLITAGKKHKKTVYWVSFIVDENKPQYF